MGRSNFEGKQTNHCKVSFVQRWLNRSRCRLGCGLAWAESIMCYMGGPDHTWEGAIVVIGAHIVKYRHFLP